MGIYIKSMDMPKDGKWFNGQLTITIFSNGDVIENVGILRPQLRIYGNVATEVPEPHGRLIDLDALIDQIDIDSAGNRGQYGDEWLFEDTIEEAPTIIERSE